LHLQSWEAKSLYILRKPGGLNLLEGDTMAGANILNLKDSNFDTEVLKSEVPVLVDFWAEWCGPCKMMAPTVDAIASEYEGKLKVGKLDVDENGGTAMRYNIRGIPTLLLFKGGRVVEQRVGAVGRSEVLKMLQSHVF
jgi:thioredoxin